MELTVNKAQKQIVDSVIEAAEKAADNGQLPSCELAPFKTEVPADKANGDFSTNAAMVNARTFRLPPRKIAEIICDNMNLEKTYFKSVEVAGPGFTYCKGCYFCR